MDNYLKSVFFEHPDHIPVNFVINAACWHHYPKNALWDLMEGHPHLFPDFRRPAPDWMPELPPVARKNEPYTDPMGCVWTTTDDGITGTVTGHPLHDLSRLKRDWHFPDPAVCDGLYFAAPENGAKHSVVSLRHGHTFLQLCDLMGYENLLYAMADEDPLLWELIDGLTEFNLSVVRRLLTPEVTLFCYPEDLGMQNGPMLSPELFRKYIVPSYQRIMAPSREAGVAIQMHSDGDIRLLADDLIKSGVQCINLQDLVNGIDWIAERYKGKYCIDLDIDRQRITPYGTPRMIDALIREEVTKLGSPQGGLAFTFGLYPGTPLENVKALMDALEKYMFFYS